MKQTKLIHWLQNRSTAAPKTRRLSQLLSLWLETSVYMQVCYKRNQRDTWKGSVSSQKQHFYSWPPDLFSAHPKFFPDIYRGATRHRNALSKGTLLSKSQRGLDQMHTDLLSTHYHLRCNRDCKLQLRIRTRSKKVIIKRIWFCQVLICLRNSVKLARTVGSVKKNHCELL